MIKVGLRTREEGNLGIYISSSTCGPPPKAKYVASGKIHERDKADNALDPSIA